MTHSHIPEEASASHSASAPLYPSWQALLAEELAQDKNPSQLLDAYARQAKGHFFLINESYQVLCGCRNSFFEDPAARRFQEAFCLTPEQQSTWGLPELQTGTRFQKTKKQIRLFLEPLPAASSGETSAWLWFSCREMPKDPPPLPLLASACSVSLRHAQDDSVCSHFLRQVLEQPSPDRAALEQMAKPLPYPLEGFLACLVIRFEPQGFLPYAYFQYRLERLFPAMNHGVCQGDVVLLYVQPQRPAERLAFSYADLQTLLDEFSAWAAISNASRHYEYLRTLYLMARNTLRLAPSLRQRQDPCRIFSQEEYSPFQVIDLCARQFIKAYRHDDMIHLIHPAVIQLCRYDQKHHSNLREVIYYYLLTGRSLSKTAQKMYMHRNTVLNKVNKILEIIQLPLEDGALQQRLLLSCLILQYYEKILGHPVRL